MPTGIYRRGRFSDAEFFRQRISADEAGSCWVWQGSMFSTGYGQARNTTAHRMSWEVHRGPIPTGGHVLHTCDNRRCVNPEHLYIGGNAENRRDACARNRYPGEAKSSRAKLTADQVAELKRIRRDEMPDISRERASKLLSARFPLSHLSIRCILAGTRWAHIKPSTKGTNP